jgi:hypothetical protein
MEATMQYILEVQSGGKWIRDPNLKVISTGYPRTGVRLVPIATRKARFLEEFKCQLRLVGGYKRKLDHKEIGAILNKAMELMDVKVVKE